MERKTFILGLLIALIYLILVIYGIKQVYTAPAIPPSKEILINKPEKIKNKILIAHTEIFGDLERPPVLFEHQKHVNALKKEGKKEWETCEVCHKVKKEELLRIKRKDEKIIEEKKEVKKVLVFEFPKKVEKREKEILKKAYHDECLDCHKEKIKEGKKSGPITCGECHKREYSLLKIKYPIVEFDFKKHLDHVNKLKERKGKEDCGLCHHVYDLKIKKLVYENKTEESCYYCHDIGKKKAGPELAKILKVTREKGLKYQKTAHERCLSCHIEINKELVLKKKKEEKAPPLECIKCHDAKYKTIEELKNVARPDRGQKEKMFLIIEKEEKKMKGVPFYHKEHETYTKTCRSCHHERLRACKDCHKLKGAPEANYVDLADAYHAVFSSYSCIGCHNEKKLEKDCAGCHKFIPIANIVAKAPHRKFCKKCHTGKKEISIPAPFSTAKLDPEVVKKEIKIKVLEKEYEPAEFPHRKIIDKLVKVSNESKLARYFHGNLETLCRGCHHQSKEEAEYKKHTPPACRNCHPISYTASALINADKLKLQGAYHTQCIGCHKYMELGKAIEKCTDCHKEKKPRPQPRDILGIKPEER